MKSNINNEVTKGLKTAISRKGEIILNLRKVYTILSKYLAYKDDLTDKGLYHCDISYVAPIKDYDIDTIIVVKNNSFTKTPGNTEIAIMLQDGTEIPPTPLSAFHINQIGEFIIYLQWMLEYLTGRK